MNEVQASVVVVLVVFTAIQVVYINWKLTKLLDEFRANRDRS